jgi:hypothetical protein
LAFFAVFAVFAVFFFAAALPAPLLVFATFFLRAGAARFVFFDFAFVFFRFFAMIDLRSLRLKFSTA